MTDPLKRSAEVLREYAEMIEDGEMHRSGPLKGRCAPAIEEELAEYRQLAEALVARSESKAIVAPGAKIAMRLKQQRDECAEALRGLVAVVEKNFPMPAGVHPGSPLDKARKALADVPTYEQQLRNIFEGIADAE